MIKVEGVSKQYLLGKIGTGALTHDVNLWWHTVKGKVNPYVKIDEINSLSTKGIECAGTKCHQPGCEEAGAVIRGY